MTARRVLSDDLGPQLCAPGRAESRRCARGLPRQPVGEMGFGGAHRRLERPEGVIEVKEDRPRSAGEWLAGTGRISRQGLADAVL